jgi:creatinine amidohydrolase
VQESSHGNGVALLPVGSFEQHGDHLPLATDTMIACAVAQRIAHVYRLQLLPPVTISCSHEHANWPGTVSISATTLSLVVEDVRQSLAASGVDRLVLVNCHGGNYVLSNVVQQTNSAVAAPQMALYPGREEWARARAAAGISTSNSEDMHAGELETSILLGVAPDVVRDSYRTADHAADDRPHLLMTGMTAYTTSGVIGMPSLATPAKGLTVLDSLTEQFGPVLELLGRPT